MTDSVTAESTSEVEAPPAVGFAFLDERVRSAVQAAASDDPNPTDPFRGLYISDDLALSLASTGTPEDVDDRLAAAARLLDLDLVESAVLGLCAAPELNPRYGRLFAYLQDDVTRKLASPRLVGHLLTGNGVQPGDIHACFANDGRLRRSGALKLLESDAALPLAERPIKLHDRLAAFLLGNRLDEPRPDARMRTEELAAYDPGRKGALESLREVLARASRLPVIVCGPDAHALLSRATGRGLVVVQARDMDDTALMADAHLMAALERRFVCFEGLEDLEPGERLKVMRAIDRRSERCVFAAGGRGASVVLGDRTTLVVDIDMTSFAERESAWRELTGIDDVEDVSAKFRLAIGQIVEAAEVARLAAAGRGEELPTGPDLDLGARQASSSRLGELAARLTPANSWKDVVLPDRQMEMLNSIQAYLRHRDLVLSQWGYDRAVARNQGLKVLFAGESGTGKTMSAQVLAKELGLDIFRVDLATIVSKYIGETEKNLDRIFSAAEGSNAILFFDEADALFGKRSEVGDSHDRYANIEVAYLLQKMEGYPGAVILATNFRKNIDDAFLRRLDFVIDFPFPEPPDRQRIWKKLLPVEAPVGDDVDLEFLARQFKLSGGAIRNCSLAGAFLAAEDGHTIEMKHLVRAVALEYNKLGRLTLESDFAEYHHLVRPKQSKTAEPG